MILIKDWYLKNYILKKYIKNIQRFLRSIRGTGTSWHRSAPNGTGQTDTGTELPTPAPTG